MRNLKPVSPPLPQHLTLWHLENEAARLFDNLFDPESGEINMEVQGQLDALEANAEKRMVSVGTWIKAKEEEKAQIELMEKALKERKAAYDKEIARWEKYLTDGMNAFNLTKISCPLFTIKLKENPLSTEIIDIHDVPEEFIRTRIIPEKVETSVDKNAVKELFKKEGKQVPGTYVSSKLKLEISTDKL